MNKPQAIAVAKAINRHLRRTKPFAGGRQFGVDYATWKICYPQTARVFNRAASIMAGRTVTSAVPNGLLN